MLKRRFIPYIVGSCIVALIFLSYVGYREYQKQVEFEAFMSKVQTTLDKETNPPEQMEARLQGKATGVPATTARHPIDVSVPPIQVGVMSKEEEAAFEPVDWSKIPPELRAKMNKLDNAPMKLQRIQTPNGNVHFIELPAGIDYSEVEITVSEDMARHPTFPPPGSFPQERSVRKSDIPEGEDVEEYLYKMDWASYLNVSVQEVGRMMERGHLPQRTNIERTPVIEFPIEALIGDDDHSGSSGSIDDARRSGEHRAEAPVSNGGLSEDTRRAPVPADVPTYLPIQSYIKSKLSNLASEGLEGSKTSALTTKSIEMRLRERLSPEHFSKAQQLIEQFGTEEGLRRLRATDPEAARQFERHPPVSPRKQAENRGPERDTPDGEESER